MFSGLSAATGNHTQLFELQQKYCTRQISRGTAKAENLLKWGFFRSWLWHMLEQQVRCAHCFSLYGMAESQVHGLRTFTLSSRGKVFHNSSLQLGWTYAQDRSSFFRREELWERQDREYQFNLIATVSGGATPIFKTSAKQSVVEAYTHAFEPMFPGFANISCYATRSQTHKNTQ